MKKIALVFLLLILTAFFLYFGNFVINDVSQKNENKNIKIGDKNYELEIVTTLQDLEKGLAKYESIKDTQGMLFVFERPDRWSIWMKGMKFNIDIIFLNEKKEVVNLYQNVKFETHQNIYDYRKYQPDYDSKYVIELKEGEISQNKLKIGDKIDF